MLKHACVYIGSCVETCVYARDKFCPITLYIAIVAGDINFLSSLATYV